MSHAKIVVTKDDAVSVVLGYIAAHDAEKITVVIPKFSSFANVSGALAKLKKVAEAVGKEIVVESVDDRVIVLAKAAGIAASNPFFDGPRDDEDNNDNEDEGDESGSLSGVVATPAVNKIRRAPPKPIRWDENMDNEEDELAPSSRGAGLARNKWVWFAVLAIIAVPAYWLAFVVLPRAEITITTKKIPWEFNNLVTIEKNGVVPSYAVSGKKNAQMSFPATGKKMTSQKAFGTITVYNGYSSKPQQLVATTRFATDNGIIVRLTKNITIPGAKIDNGTITPSSIEADVIADKPGVAYNIGPVKKLTIPGFKGTPKFDGFYGEIQKPLAGGFVGENAYPTDADIKAAKIKITAVLEESLRSQMAVDRASSAYIIIDGAKQIVITKTDVNPQANAKGEFSVFGEAEFKAIGFKENDMLGFLTGKMKEALMGENQKAAYVFKETNLTYGVPKADFAALNMSLPVDLKSIVEQPIDMSKLRNEVIGKSENDLKAILFAIPGIDKAEVTLWPGYVTGISSDPSPNTLKFIIQ